MESRKNVPVGTVTEPGRPPIITKPIGTGSQAPATGGQTPSDGQTQTSHTVRAADGTTITWSLGAGGRITATGGHGQMLELTLPPAGSAASSLSAVFTQNASRYLTIGRSANTGTGGVEVTVANPTSTVNLSMPAVGHSQSVQATVSGHIATAPLSWSGTLSLQSNALAALHVVPGWRSNLFASQLALANYFRPLYAALAAANVQAQIGGSEPAPSQPHASPRAESTGAFFAKAAGWGVAAILTTIATGGTDLIVLATVGLAGADASMFSDDVDLWDSQQQQQETVTTVICDPNEDPATDGQSPTSGSNPDGGDIPTDGNPSSGGCFAAGTEVSLGGGLAQLIEQIQAGQLVTSRHERTGEAGRRPVTRTWRHERRATLDLQLDNGELIRTTSVHRFFTAGRGLQPAAELRCGDQLETADGEPRTIVAIDPGPGHSTVYNLTVEAFHTYFVGRSRVWVHNDKDEHDPDGDPDGGSPPDDSGK